MDDYGEFCDDLDKPSFVFGAATHCELAVGHILTLAAVSYGLCFILLLPVGILLSMAQAALWRRR